MNAVTGDGLSLIYRDAEVVVVNKPSGMFTHPTPLSKDPVTLMELARDACGQWVYPLHRLDRATSGVLVFALSKDAARRWAPLFEKREVRKRYWAIVRGWPPEWGTIDRPLANLDAPHRMQEAVTHFRVRARGRWPVPHGKYPEGRFALVEVAPETGRMHQIRRHLRGIDHPVINDSAHGDTRINRYFREQIGIDRLLLHAVSLGCRDPRDETPRCFEAPLDAAFDDMIARFSWRGTPDLRWPAPVTPA